MPKIFNFFEFLLISLSFFNNCEFSISEGLIFFLSIKDWILSKFKIAISFLEIGLLPVLMGSSMWLQMKLSPQPSGSDEMQKIQKKIFMLMPLFLTVILAPFAAGLILYWVCTNILTIVQQYIINRNIKVKS